MLRLSDNVDTAICNMLIGPWLLDETATKEFGLTCGCSVGSGALTFVCGCGVGSAFGLACGCGVGFTLTSMRGDDVWPKLCERLADV